MSTGDPRAIRNRRAWDSNNVPSEFEWMISIASNRSVRLEVFERTSSDDRTSARRVGKVSKCLTWARRRNRTRRCRFDASFVYRSRRKMDPYEKRSLRASSYALTIRGRRWTKTRGRSFGSCLVPGCPIYFELKQVETLSIYPATCLFVFFVWFYSRWNALLVLGSSYGRDWLVVKIPSKQESTDDVYECTRSTSRCARQLPDAPTNHVRVLFRVQTISKDETGTAWKSKTERDRNENGILL